MKQTQRATARPSPVQARTPVDRITPDPAQGLSAAQVKQRQQCGWANTPVDSPTKSVGRIVRENVCTFFNFIFLVLGVLLILVGSFDDMLFLLIALANTVIGILQQLRSKQTVDKLNLLAAPRANAVRQGSVLSVPCAQLVRDDVVEFTAGDQIPADATVLSGQVQVNESLVTGEADAITKSRGDGLLSGAFVVSGKCRARLDQVGADSYAARLTLEAKKDVTAGKSEMMSSLDRLIRFIGMILIPLGLALFVKEYYFLELGMQQAVVSTVAALIGMIPEGLYLLTSVALTVSVLRLAQGKVLAQDMSCIETLARVDVLCVDKTGTITEPQMQVGETVLLDEARFSEMAVTDALNAFYKVMDADNDTARAMQERFHGVSVWHASHTVPFSSAAKWSAAVFPGHGAFVVGAPEFILGNRYAQIKDQVEPHSAKGYRVLLLASYDGIPDQKSLIPHQVSPMALILLSNRVRPAAPKTFRYFAEQGVAVKVISGDNPVTVSEVARQAGIPGAERYIDATALKNDGELERAVEKYTVFGRVTPGQKRKLIRALQRAGHTVAMTGDGVNDVLALKDADCGIAMASGSDAACHAAQLVLLSSDFSAMPKVVAEGRRVINNIQRAAALFLVKNIFSFFLSILSLFASFPYPVTPLQLSMLSALTIGVPSFFLALEPNYSMVKGRFLGNVFRRALPGGIADLLIVLGLEVFYWAFAFSTEELSTMAAISLLFIGLLVLYQVCKPFNWMHRVVWGAMAGSSAVTVLFFGAGFGLNPLSLQAFLILLAFLGLCFPVMQMMLFFFERGTSLLDRRRNPRGHRQKTVRRRQAQK